MITFEDAPITRIVAYVKLDGRPVGEIYHTPGGFTYIPRGTSRGGEFYPTLDLCKQSLL